MFAERLKRLRLARGLSLDGLVAELGGLITKQAISKYERGIAKPSAFILNKIAVALGVKSAYLLNAPQYSVEFIAYRKGCGLLKKEQARIEATVVQELENRIRVQDILGYINGSDIPVQGIQIKKYEDCEKAADHIRTEWGLGSDPLANVSAILEDHFVHVIEVSANEKFDGISAVARTSDGKVKAAAVASRDGVSGERQRLNLSHELGHLVLKVASGLNEERAAFRFGAALLAPAGSLLKEAGTKRGAVRVEELLMLKHLFGMSIQALVFRLHQLGVITDSHYKKLCIFISQAGWKKREPEELVSETPRWFRRNVIRALAEGIITKDEAETMLNEKLPEDRTKGVSWQRSLMKLPLEERRRIMAEQASKLVGHYEDLVKKGAFDSGDYIEYKAKSKTR